MFRLVGGMHPPHPLWVARIAKLHRKVSKIEAWHPPPPLCKLGIRFDHTKGIYCALLLGFRLEIELNLSEDLFFCSSPNFGRKIGLISGGTISDSNLCSSHVFQSFCPPPPPFKILRTLLCLCFGVCYKESWLVKRGLVKYKDFYSF